MARRAADSTAERLLEAAFRVLVEQGWAGCSVRDIARLTGVAPGLLYHYFGSKQGLLLAVIDRYNVVAEVAAWLAARADEPATVVLPALAREMGRLLNERGRLLPLLLGEAPRDETLRARCESLMGQSLAALAGYLEARVAAGELRPHPTRIAARTWLSTLQLSRLLGDFDEVAEALPGLLLDGLLETRGGASLTREADDGGGRERDR